MTEEDIRKDEREKMAQHLLEVLAKSKRTVQPGLWYAASILDPTINE